MQNNNPPATPAPSKDTAKKVTFFIDKEKFEVTAPENTVRALLVDFAKQNPEQTTLMLKKGNEIHKYTNLDEVVTLENGMHFAVLHNTPTTVS